MKEELVLERADNFVVLFDYSMDVLCSKCKTWEHLGKETPRASMLYENRNRGMAASWTCSKCYRGKGESKGAELQNAGVQGYHIGQALNLAQAELLHRGMDSTRVDYWEALLELRDEYLKNAVLK